MTNLDWLACAVFLFGAGLAALMLYCGRNHR